MSGIFEYVTGSDSFRAAQGHDPRAVTLTALVYNPKSGLFENPKYLTNKGDVCKVDKVHKVVPASNVLAVSPGNWYYYRAEVRSGALWCLVYKKRSGGIFEFDTQTLLVRSFRNASLLRAQLSFPEHPHANLTYLDFIWNAQRVVSHDKLTANELAAFKKLLGATSNFVVEATQKDSELSSWSFTELEKAKPQIRKTIKVRDKPIAIQRVKRLKL
jgi:hypothetical protein